MFDHKTSIVIVLTIFLLLIWFKRIQIGYHNSWRNASLIKLLNNLNKYHYQASFPLGNSDQVDHLKTYIQMSKQINSISQSTSAESKKQALYNLIHDTAHNLWESLNFQTHVVKDGHHKSDIICRKNHDKERDKHMNSRIKQLSKRYRDNSNRNTHSNNMRYRYSDRNESDVTFDHNKDILRMTTIGMMPKMIQEWNKVQVIKSLGCDELILLHRHEMLGTDVILIGDCSSFANIADIAYDESGDVIHFPPMYSSVYAYYNNVSDMIRKLKRHYPRTPVVWTRPAYDLDVGTIRTTSLIQENVPHEKNDLRQFTLYRDLVALCEFLTIKYIVHDLGISVLPLPLDGRVSPLLSPLRVWDAGKESTREWGLDWATSSVYGRAQVSGEISAEVIQALQHNLLWLVCDYSRSITTAVAISRSNLRNNRDRVRIGSEGRSRSAVGDERRHLIKTEIKKENRGMSRIYLRDQCTSNLLYSRKYNHHCMPRPRLLPVIQLQTYNEKDKDETKETKQSHPLHRLYKLLVTGLGGAGTHSITRALQDMGIDVRHEALAEDGSVSWLYAVNDVLLGRQYPFKAGLNLTPYLNMDHTAATSTISSEDIVLLPRSWLPGSQAALSPESDEGGYEYMSVWAPRFETVLHLTRQPLSHISTFSGHLRQSFLFIHESLHRIRYSEAEHKTNIAEKFLNTTVPGHMGNPLGEFVSWGVRDRNISLPLSSCLQPHVMRGSVCRLPLAAAAWLHWTRHVHILADATFAVEKLTSNNEEDKKTLNRLILMLLCNDGDAVNLGSSQSVVCSKIRDSSRVESKKKRKKTPNNYKMHPSDIRNPAQVHNEYSLEDISRIDKELVNQIVILAKHLNLQIDRRES